jgi:hypothetical protein
MDTTKALHHVSLDATLLDFVAVHGNLCLALRHPENTGDSRAMVISMIHRLGKLLVEGGILTQAELDFASRVEQEEFGQERIV